MNQYDVFISCKSEDYKYAENQKSLLQEIKELNAIKAKLSKEPSSSKAIIQNLHCDIDDQTEEITILRHQISQSNNLIRNLSNRLSQLQNKADNTTNKRSQNSYSSTQLPIGYSVLVSFCPTAAMNIVKEFLPSFPYTSVSQFKDDPIRVATYGTRSYAENLKKG